MKWPRFSVRSILLFVLLVGLALGLGLPAIEVARSVEHHPHAFVEQRQRGKYMLDVDGQVVSPFWPRYARRLAGKPWKERRICGGSLGRIEEICAFDYPENFVRSCFHREPLIYPTDEMVSKIRALNALATGTSSVIKEVR